MNKPERDKDTSQSAGFDELFRALYPQLFSYARTLLGDGDMAKDAVQECFLKLWRNREGLPGITDVRRYMMKMVHNYCLDHFTSKNTTSKADLDLESIGRRLEIMGLAGDDGIFDRLFSQQLQTRLQAEIDRLPTQCRRIFIMGRLEGMPYADIAAAQGVSLSTVKNQMVIAMRKLYEALKEHI